MSVLQRTFARRAAAVLLATAAAAAQATLLTFEELPWPPPDPLQPVPYIPVDTQYASLGVSFEGTMLTRWPDTTSQLLLFGNPGAIVFSGKLPLHVSFHITSTLADGESWAVASGPGGYSQRAGTGGWPGGEAPHPYPYPEDPVRNQWVSFSSASGIARLDLFNAYNLRFGALVDNLYFGAVPAVPEPAPGTLAAAGLLCLAAAVLRPWRRRRAGPRSGAARSDPRSSSGRPGHAPRTPPGWPGAGACPSGSWAAR